MQAQIPTWFKAKLLNLSAGSSREEPSCFELGWYLGTIILKNS
jgi:hypothetical protein